MSFSAGVVESAHHPYVPHDNTFLKQVQRVCRKNRGLGQSPATKSKVPVVLPCLTLGHNPPRNCSLEFPLNTPLWGTNSNGGARPHSDSVRTVPRASELRSLTRLAVSSPHFQKGPTSCRPKGSPNLLSKWRRISWPTRVPRSLHGSADEHGMEPSPLN